MGSSWDVGMHATVTSALNEAPLSLEYMAPGAERRYIWVLQFAFSQMSWSEAKCNDAQMTKTLPKNGLHGVAWAARRSIGMH